MDLKIRCCQTTQKIILVIVLAVIALAVIVNIVATLMLNYRLQTLVDNNPQIHQIKMRLHTVETIVNGTIEPRVTELESKVNYTVETEVVRIIERVKEVERNVTTVVKQLQIVEQLNSSVTFMSSTVKEVERNVTTVVKQLQIVEQLNSSVTFINSTVRIVDSLLINGDVDNETTLIITNMMQQVESVGLKIDEAESNLNLIEVRISNIESQNLTGKI